VLVFGIILMRSMLEKSETNLVKQNATLQAKQDEIEAQHEELLQQQEEVLSSNEKLDQANRFILQQQKKLEQYNEQLQVLVQEKSRELIEANNQLIRHNNEMVEFSHAVSHHLRAPVARMLGLSHLLKLVDTEAERKGLGELVFTSSKDLDAVLRDLSTIIDIRHHLYVREDLLLKEDWDAVMRERSPVNASSYSCQVDFSSAPVISGIRPMVRSIFYHALSNCIRFRSARHLQIGVTSEEMEGRINVSITDNGLGFDAMAHSADLFKLYKKFHPAISGKGLGLYMIKAQMEAMGGEAMLTSKAGEGTTLMLQFRVH
jgi:light-regulated signal transduction histidine kinase (bacteriophytochrome)